MPPAPAYVVLAGAFRPQSPTSARRWFDVLRAHQLFDIMCSRSFLRQPCPHTSTQAILQEASPRLLHASELHAIAKMSMLLKFWAKRIIWQEIKVYMDSHSLPAGSGRTHRWSMDTMLAAGTRRCLN